MNLSSSAGINACGGLCIGNNATGWLLPVPAIINVGVYVDCFNLYHSLFSFCPKCRARQKHDHTTCEASKYKWCDMQRLAELFVNHGHGEKIKLVKLFSAVPTHLKGDKDKLKRHFAFFDANKGRGCEVINGTFSKLSKQEKKTDTGLCVNVMNDFYTKTIDAIILVTNDSDFVPLIEQMAKYNVKITIVRPPNVPTCADITNTMIKIKNKKNEHNKINRTPHTTARPKLLAQFFKDVVGIKDITGKMLLDCQMPDISSGVKNPYAE